jgi:hypothetical protein
MLIVHDAQLDQPCPPDRSTALLSAAQRTLCSPNPAKTAAGHDGVQLRFHVANYGVQLPFKWETSLSNKPLGSYLTITATLAELAGANG